MSCLSFPLLFSNVRCEIYGGGKGRAGQNPTYKTPGCRDIWQTKNTRTSFPFGQTCLPRLLIPASEYTFVIIIHSGRLLPTFASPSSPPPPVESIYLPLPPHNPPPMSGDPTWAEIAALFQSPYWIAEADRTATGDHWITEMKKFSLDLSSYSNVKRDRLKIYEVIKNARMPPQEEPGAVPFPPAAVARFKEWIDIGFPGPDD